MPYALTEYLNCTFRNLFSGQTRYKIHNVFVCNVATRLMLIFIRSLESFCHKYQKGLMRNKSTNLDRLFIYKELLWLPIY